MARRVKGAKRLGTPVGNWLTADQGKRLLLTADGASLRGKRDYVTLAILLGCGLTALWWLDEQPNWGGCRPPSSWEAQA